MKRFPIHFRDHVTPKLRNLAAAEAVCVARGVETFSGAYDAILAYARAHGALYLPENRLEELEDWISTTLLAEIDRAERVGAE